MDDYKKKIKVKIKLKKKTSDEVLSQEAKLAQTQESYEKSIAEESTFSQSQPDIGYVERAEREKEKLSFRDSNREFRSRNFYSNRRGQVESEKEVRYQERSRSFDKRYPRELGDRKQQGDQRFRDRYRAGFRDTRGDRYSKTDERKVDRFKASQSDSKTVRKISLAEKLGVKKSVTPPTPVQKVHNKFASRFRAKKKEVFEEVEELLEEERNINVNLGSQKVEKYAVPENIEIPEVITVGDFAKKLNLKSSIVIDKLAELGLEVVITDKIDADTASIIASEFGCEVRVRSIYDEIRIEEEPDDPRYVKERVPVVTVMGHVDHGKTTLLDVIRNTNVAARETGGITQHIGASVVEINGKKITFIDTPGHEAFTAIRAKGAKVTDIVILVVAADDGVKEQTIEALNHAKEAGVTIIVAINKIDAAGANPERVKQQLSNYGLIPEEWGGDTMYVEVSALKRKNIDKLLEAILLQAEIMELKADYHKKGIGYVIDSRIDPGKGTVFTLIVKNGIVKVGDNFVVGNTYGKVRALFDDKGNKIDQVTPGLPAEVLRAESLPELGAQFNVVEDEELARDIAKKREYLSKVEGIKTLSKKALDAFSDKKELKYIIKADVIGSVEAIKYSLEGLSVEDISVRIIHSGVGQVTESDVMLASTAYATILAFRTRVDTRAIETAEKEKVKIKKYNIIYDLIEDVKKDIKGLKEPILAEKILGVAEVRKVFNISGVGAVAGCFVKQGVIQRKAKVRIYRDNKLVFDGNIKSLKRLKDDVSEVKEGFEFGISFENFNDIKDNDVIECYTMVEQES